jgi:hypothetical protein
MSDNLETSINSFSRLENGDLSFLSINFFHQKLS